MTQQTILVTGGAGYIGSHTIVALLEKNEFRVISVDNYTNSSEQSYTRIEQITGKNVTYVKADLSVRAEAENVFSEFPEITSVIHFAAFKSVPESVAQPDLYYRNNLDSLRNVIECGQKYSLRNFIFSSSCSVYGNIEVLPVSESTPLSAPESPYADTKVKGEEMMKHYFGGSNVWKGISLRYFNPVGAHESGLLGELPNQRPNNLVPVITQTAIGRIPSMSVFGSDYPTRDGTCIRDYIHVCDIAEAHVLALKRLIDEPTAPSYDLYNLGSGNGVTVLEAITAFEKVSGRKLNYKLVGRREGDVASIYSDSSKALRELHWSAKRTLEEMMASAWKWEQHLSTEKK